MTYFNKFHQNEKRGCIQEYHNILYHYCFIRTSALLSDIKARFGKFFTKCRECKNKIVKAAATAALVNPMSCAGRNYWEVLNACYDKKIIYNESNSKYDEMKDCVNVLKEMIDIRDGFKQYYILSSEDIDFIIEDICINWFLNLFIYKTNQMYH